jgi:hypothetical protein
VVGAAQAVVLVAAEKKRRATVRTPVIENSDAASGVAERDQLLAQQHQTHLLAVPLELGGKTGGNPELPHEFPHRGVAVDAGSELFIGFVDHLALLMNIECR